MTVFKSLFPGIWIKVNGGGSKRSNVALDKKAENFLILKIGCDSLSYRLNMKLDLQSLFETPKSQLVCCLGTGKPVAATAACRHLEFGGTAAATTTDQSDRRIWVAGFLGRPLQAGHWEKRQKL
jgi:hypothetical protein